MQDHRGPALLENRFKPQLILHSAHILHIAHFSENYYDIINKDPPPRSLEVLQYMHFLNWLPEYSVGIDELDRQHRDLIKWINQFHESMTRGQEKQETGFILASLSRYIETHFPGEEEFLQTIRYPLLEQHQDAHRNLSSQVTSFKKRYDRGQIIAPHEILEFLRNWITGHVSKEDGKYAEYLKSGENISGRLYIIWNPDLELGNSELDEENRRFCRFFNELHAACAMRIPGESIRSIFQSLLEFCRECFASEEQYLDEIMYPYYDSHKAEHDQLLGLAEGSQFQLESDDPDVMKSALHNLYDWIITHITGESARYIEYVTRRMVDKEAMFVTWNGDLSVKIEVMDKQHKKILQDINQIHELEGSDSRARALEAALTMIINDMKTHFFSEEDLMRKIKYPRAAIHKKHHDFMTAQMLDIQKNHILGRAADPEKLAILVRDWLFEHIEREDKKYSEFFRSHAVSHAKLFITWEPEYSVNNPAIDKEHKSLFHLLNQIYAAMNVESEWENVEKLLKNLAFDLKSHFAKEERMMQTVGFAGLPEHIKAHEKLTKQIMSLQVWGKSSRALTAVKDLRLMRGWLLDHIKYIDSKYSNHFAATQKIQVPVKS